MKFSRCKGSRDLSPDEMRRFRHIEGIFCDSCLKWGYEEVRTPTLEYLHLFTSTGTLTPSLLGKVYSFLDWDGWSGERVVLRPDGTIPVARLYTDSMADRGLAKLFYLNNIFIFEATGKETREKWQCGAELIGGGSPVADIELVMLALEILERIGLKDIGLRLSHAGMVRALLEKSGLTLEERAVVFDRILDGDITAITGVKSGELSSITPLLLDLKGKSSGFLRNIRALFNQHFPELETELGNFIEILDGLEALGCRYEIDLTTGRSFEYYTGMMFQIYAGEVGVGGGGRYDALIPLLGGRQIPASGFALYLDELMSLVKLESPADQRRILIRIEPEETMAMKEGFAMARRLRDSGYTVQLKLGSYEPANLVWTIDISGKPPRFVLAAPSGRQRSEAQTAKEVLALLGAG